MGGLMLLLGKAKKPGSSEDEPDDAAPASEPSESPERSLAREAFAALKDDDEEGFIDAFIGAARACKAKATSGGYADEDEETDDEA